MNTKNTHARFYSLLKELPYATKEELVYAHSENQTTSLNEFHQTNPNGYANMLQEMNIVASKREQLVEIKRLRSAVLLRVQKLGIDTTDWDKVNQFLLLKKIAGQPLYNLSAVQMRALIPKLESMLKKHNEKT